MQTIFFALNAVIDSRYRQKCRLVHSDPDKNCEFGPPDKTTNFEVTSSRKRPSASTSKSCFLPSSKKVAHRKMLANLVRNVQPQKDRVEVSSMSHV